jgi:phage terminase large subunit-like protein
LDSLNVSLAAIDELHAHKTRDVWDVLDTATGARLQSLLLATTTAGKSTAGICYEQVDYLHKVLEGVYADEAFFGIEYTTDKGDDWRTEASWRKANPNFGVSVQPDDLSRKAHQAQRSRSAEDNFKTKHLNVWIGAGSGWFPVPEWQALADPRLTVEQLRAAPCWIGVDLAEVRDFASVVAVFRPDDERYVFLGRHYLPEDAVEASSIAAMSGWVKAGHIIETPGNQADFLRIEDDLVAWCERLNVQEIDFDRALASRMTQNLARRLEPSMGKDAVERFIVTVPQTVEIMNPAMQMMESLVLAGKVAHDGNPVFAWMWSNVVSARNFKDELYPRKAGGKDSSNKIDGAVAALTALSRAMAPPVVEAPPAYQVMVFGAGRR